MPNALPPALVSKNKLIIKLFISWGAFAYANSSPVMLARISLSAMRIYAGACHATCISFGLYLFALIRPAGQADGCEKQGGAA